MAEPLIATALRTEAWATIEDPTMTIEEAVAELVALGNTVLDVDYAGRRIKVADNTVQITPAEAVALGFPATMEATDA